jgi:hypothetical protein
MNGHRRLFGRSDLSCWPLFRHAYYVRVPTIWELGGSVQHNGACGELILQARYPGFSFALVRLLS